jgi:Uma2 family endonuclease
MPAVALDKHGSASTIGPMPLAPPITAEQLAGINDGRHRFELIEGRLVVMEPGGWAHGMVSMSATLPVANWIAEQGLGRSFVAETGFIIKRNPDTVRAPDFAFVREERIPGKLSKGFFEIAPDFAIEVISFDDTPREVHDKARQWIEAGVGEVWVVDPKKQTLTVYLPGQDSHELTPGDRVKASGLLTGFTYPVAKFFD